ncbi:hypothetical protein SeMB42_g00948 [Synchytrium endobioticum]|uniref:Uncharacterized protein n=1 Tax=Synchytrium endobioticum TaxID=286115 RepID=A0A507DP17_9FUNG|nr:hypothetical protein SeLEV6574_g01754 [Synchytrium endobioticum]TPX53161.1 hypothetical protein SeMB42_g00948 [Synchytrium endobioticum]
MMMMKNKELKREFTKVMELMVPRLAHQTRPNIAIHVTRNPITVILARLLVDTVPRTHIVALHDCGVHSQPRQDVINLGIKTYPISDAPMSTIASIHNVSSNLCNTQMPKHHHARLLYTAYNHNANTVLLPTCIDDIGPTKSIPDIWKSAYVHSVLPSVHMGIGQPLLPFSKNQLNAAVGLEESHASEAEHQGTTGNGPFSERMLVDHHIIDTSMKSFIASRTQFIPPLGFATISLPQAWNNRVVIESCKRILSWLRFLGSNINSASLTQSISELHKLTEAGIKQKWTSIPIDDTASFYCTTSSPQSHIMGLRKPLYHTEPVDIEIGQTISWDHRYYIRIKPPNKNLAQHGAGVGSAQSMFGIPAAHLATSDHGCPAKLIVRNLQTPDIMKCLHSYLPSIRGFETQTYTSSLLRYILTSIPPALIPTLPCICIKYATMQRMPWHTENDSDYLVAIPSLNLNFEPGLFQVEIARANPLPLQSWSISMADYHVLDLK